MISAQLQPVAGIERIALIDVLRGFSLLGILLVNFMGDAGSIMPQMDALMSSALVAFVAGSFYPLFSFLFGLGFALQVGRASSRGSAVSLVYFRRILVLFAIGTVHAVFVWEGDILVRYSVTALLLIPLQRIGQRSVFALTLLLFVIILNGEALGGRVEQRGSADDGISAVQPADERATDERISGNQPQPIAEGGASYAVETADRWKAYTRRLRAYGHWQNWVLNDVLVCFLVGFMIGRKRVLHEPAKRIRDFRIAAIVALIVAASGLLTNTILDLPRGFLAALSYYAENFGMTAFYISAIALLYASSPGARRALNVFAPPGRMALTNYLTQSVVMTIMSMSYGLGWQPATTAWVAVNLAFFFGVQVPLSHLWLSHFQYGPAEWLWRSLSYGTRQPMRRLARGATEAEPAATPTV